MITFPNAKINLGLNITEKRPDGYHNLETVFYPIPVTDALEITELKNSGKEKFTLQQAGVKIDGNAKDNLVIRAYELMDKKYNLPPTEIHLVKHIPTGAGLGGGSSDAAFMLKLLNTQYSLNLTDNELEQMAAQLGADCAFFIKDKPTYAEGIGDIFSPISLSLAGYQLWLVKPNIFVSTKDAFAHIIPHRPDYNLQDTVQLPVNRWKEVLTNDFEESVFLKHPFIHEIKLEMYRQGALYASMSGSGSSVYGIFPTETQLPEKTFGKEAFEYKGILP